MLLLLQTIRLYLVLCQQCVKHREKTLTIERMCVCAYATIRYTRGVCLWLADERMENKEWKTLNWME